MVEIRSDDWRVMLRFRDLLRMNPALASEYAREKERLALLHSGYREVYQREKDMVVESILARDEVV
jgi:GrpB-like predicted nucleotidyltransferase (UPF0157 family)